MTKYKEYNGKEVTVRNYVLGNYKYYISLINYTFCQNHSAVIII